MWSSLISVFLSSVINSVMEVSSLIVVLILSVVLLVLYKRLFRTHITVNCWFCNKNSSVLVAQYNNWKCQHCDQYNGFKQDGDYNCDIGASSEGTEVSLQAYCSPSNLDPSTFANGLCTECNINQEKKLTLLASFQPMNDANYDKEIQHFRENLEHIYHLCPSCEVVVQETLSRKKTLILASNLNLTGLKTGHTRQNYLRKVSVKIVSGISTTLALALALSLTLPLFESSISEPSNCLPLPSCHHYSNVPFFLPFKAVCPATFYNVSCGDVFKTEYFRLWYKTLKTKHLPLSFTLLVLNFISHLYFDCNWLLAITCLSQVSFALCPLFIFSLPVYAHWIQVCTSWVIFFVSLTGVYSKKPMLKTPLKRLGSSSSMKQHFDTLSRTATDCKVTNSTQSPFPHLQAENFPESSSKNTVPFPLRVEITPTSLPNYLTLPTKSSTLRDPLPSNSKPPVVLPSGPLGPFDQESCPSQEDARSDASVDSAFSNADSAIFDSAETVGSSLSSFSESHRDGDTDFEVQSLINSLSLGSCQRKRNRSHTFTTKHYGKKNRMPLLLKPSKLDSALNESWNSNFSINRSDRNYAIVPACETFTKQCLNARSVSPTDSVHSQESQNSFISKPAPLVKQSWNGQSIFQNSLPNPISSSLPFTQFGSPPFIPNQFPQVLYTTYGLNHQPISNLWNTSAFTVPQPSYTFRTLSSRKAPNLPHPKNPVNFRNNDLLDYESEDDLDSLSMSQKGLCKHKDLNLSSSFIDSVWQSRSVIIYTTICYIVIGCVIVVFCHMDKISNLIGSS